MDKEGIVLGVDHTLAEADNTVVEDNRDRVVVVGMAHIHNLVVVEVTRLDWELHLLAPSAKAGSSQVVRWGVQPVESLGMSGYLWWMR